MSWGYSNPSHGTANLTATSGEAVPANPNRKFLRVTNDGTATVYLRFGTAAAVAQEGLRLASSGGSYEMSFGLGNVWSGAIQGITAGGSSKIIYIDGE